MEKFGVYLDPGMVRNVLRTDPAEAGELLTWDLLPHLFFFLVLPLALLFRLRLQPLGGGRGLLRRLVWLLAAFALAVGGLALTFKEVASLMRNHKEVRYLITPENVVYSLAATLRQDARTVGAARQVIGGDAAPGPGWARRSRPVLLVFVVGETARAANWGLHAGSDGQPRQTTPELARRADVITFADVTSCGTSTEVSLPCMFSVQGRRHYDEAAIRGSDSLLHVLARAGFEVIWRDNQAGCKGVCAGLREERRNAAKDPRFCDGERCLDDILIDGADALVADGKGNRVLVLHQLGSHGPAYYRRYPDDLRRFLPTCDTPDLSQCDRAQIINSYDNSLLYTDRFLAHSLDFLERQAAHYDTALIYVSDHGESLGENGLFLHGMPYAIAPAEQTHVPMLMWFSPAYRRDFGLDPACMRQVARRPASHDHLFHTVLGLLDVATTARDPELDLSAACRH
jgi:lipid A ethanolaminephosphotransferase